nr:MAG TPA: hypothetical protein [Caudoviricetes sp.]
MIQWEGSRLATLPSRCDTGQGPERKPRERSGLCHTGGWVMIDDANL